MGRFKTTAKLIIAFGLMLSGCTSAHLVQETFQPTKGGVVKYKNGIISGSGSEKKAEEIMSNYCAPGTYSLIERRHTAETVAYQTYSNGSATANCYGGNCNGSYNGSATTTPINARFVYVQFKCEEAERDSAAVSKSASCQDECYAKDGRHGFSDSSGLESCLQAACK